MAWDESDAIDWERGVDFTRPFVPLDRDNLLFPDISRQERLAVSQYMGMMIAATFSEMELTMQRLRDVCWQPFMRRHAVNPELIALGHEFFDEEAKHARVFQRYLDACAKGLGVAPEELKSVLPRVNPGYVDRVLAENAKNGGLSLWWIVATVEEESVLIYRQMHSCRDKLDPLYYELHRRHFEEEARHAPYPFLMLSLGDTHAGWLRKADFAISQVLKAFWLFFELAKTPGVARLKDRHPFFRTLAGLMPRLKDRSIGGIVSSLVRETPYISCFINPLFHPETKKAVAKSRVFALPFPEPNELPVTW